MTRYSLDILYPFLVFKNSNASTIKPLRRSQYCESLHELTGYSKDRLISITQELTKQGLIVESQMFMGPTKHAEEIIYWERGMTLPDKKYSIDERKAARFKLLEKIYEETNAHQGTSVSIYDAGILLGFSNYLTRITYDYLSDENLLISKLIIGVVSLTHNGIVEYERAVGNPEVQTTYFPAVTAVDDILRVKAGMSS